MRRMLLPEKKIKSKIKDDKASVSFGELEQYLKEDVVVIQLVINKMAIATSPSPSLIFITDDREGELYYIPNGAILTIQSNNDGIIIATNIIGDTDLNEIRQYISFENYNMSELSIYGSSVGIGGPYTLFDVYIIDQD